MSDKTKANTFDETASAEGAEQTAYIAIEPHDFSAVQPRNMAPIGKKRGRHYNRHCKPC